MPKIQSRNIGTLCAELGFDGTPSTRDPKILTEAVKEFRKNFVQQGNDLVFSRSDSPEALYFAQCFCEEDNRGDEYWPSIEDNLWPCWQTDKERILISLAHIFALQAFYEYQGAGKRRRSNKTVQRSPSIQSEAHSSRELSPESRVYTGPSAPKGTRSRPVTGSNSSPPPYNIDMATGNVESFTANDKPDIHQAAREEIAALDPRKDNKPIKEFTEEWLVNADAPWPVAADIKLRFLMHDNHSYDTGKDFKIIPIVTGLRRGTPLSTGEAREFKLFEKKVLLRANIMISRLHDQKLVETNNGSTFRTPIFRDYWRNRYCYWKPKAHTSKNPSSDVADSYDNFDFSPFLEQGDQTVETAAPLTPVKTPSRLSRPPSNNIERDTATTSRIRKELDGEYSDHTVQPPTKKQKTSTTSANQKRSIPEPISIPSQRASISRTNMDSRDDTQSNSTGFIQEPINSRRVSPPALPGDLPEPSRLASPIHLEAPSEASAGKTAASISPTLNSNQPTLTPKEILPKRRSSIVNPRQPSSKRLIFILPKSSKPEDPDLLNPVSFDYIREKDCTQFFKLVAERAYMSLEDLQCLTFTLLFTKGEQMYMVTAEDENFWADLKTRINYHFKNLRSKPWHREVNEFEVGVDIGNLTGDGEDSLYAEN